MPVCSNCENENLDNSSHCFYCGKKLPAKGCYIPRINPG